MKRKIITTLIFVLMTQFFFAQEWLTSMDEAKKAATENGKPIVLVFAGSDWCAPCIKLEKEIWESEEFKNHAKDNLVMLKADFPRRKKNQLSDSQQEHNNNLAEKYNRGGVFPLVVVLNKDGKVLGTTSYKKTTPEKYIALINSFIK